MGWDYPSWFNSMIRGRRASRVVMFGERAWAAFSTPLFRICVGSREAIGRGSVRHKHFLLQSGQPVDDAFDTS